MRRMETPPSYAPAKKSNTGLIIGLVLGGIAICCVGGVALLFFGGLQMFKQVAPMAECMMNYSVIEKALSDYEKEHDGKLPAAATWQDDLKPYVEKALVRFKKEAGPFKLMEPNGEWGCVAGGTKTGMAYNTDANGKTMEEVRGKNLVTVFETMQTGRNLAIKYVEQPRSSSPKMMGNPRGWIKIVGGKTDMDGQNTNMNFESSN
jgi:hypothetical protein